MPTVPQTSVIFFGLLVGFVVFITIRGELAGYLWVIGLGGGKPASSSPTTPTTPTTPSTPSTPSTGGGLPPYTQNPDGSICVGNQCSVMAPPRKKAL